MDLIIKGMDMPKSCFECRFYQSDMDYCEATGTDYPYLEEVKLKDCPLVEVPTPHGRLIDADALSLWDIDVANYPSNYIKNAPTIIEAEEQE